MEWVTYLLTFLAGGTLGAVVMAIVAINRVESDFDYRDDWPGDDVHRRGPDRADRDRGL
jgi:hypothetical protein